MAYGGDPKASTTIVYGLVGVILLLAVVVFTTALYYDMERQQTVVKAYSRPNPEITRLRNEQLERINSYRWVNQDQGIAAIPIGRAIELTAADLKAGRSAHRIPLAQTQPAETESNQPATEPGGE